MRRYIAFPAQVRTLVLGSVVLVVLAGATARRTSLGGLVQAVHAAGIVNFIATDASGRGSSAWAPDASRPARNRSPS